jgi:DNA-directed RNA polymerase sigma subunit (sigma70/sigma32)
MSDEREITTAAIGRELNIAPATVRDVERKAIEKFKRELERRGIRLDDVLPS